MISNSDPALNEAVITYVTTRADDGPFQDMGKSPNPAGGSYLVCFDQCVRMKKHWGIRRCKLQMASAEKAATFCLAVVHNTARTGRLWYPN